MIFAIHVTVIFKLIYLRSHESFVSSIISLSYFFSGSAQMFLIHQRVLLKLVACKETQGWTNVFKHRALQTLPCNERTGIKVVWRS